MSVIWMLPNLKIPMRKKEVSSFLLKTSLVIPAWSGESDLLTLTHSYFDDRPYWEMPMWKPSLLNRIHHHSHTKEVGICKLELGQHEAIWCPCGQWFNVHKISKHKAEPIQRSAAHAQFYTHQMFTTGLITYLFWTPIRRQHKVVIPISQRCFKY